MKFFTRNLCGYAIALVCACTGGDAFSAAANNPRGNASSASSGATATVNTNTARGEARRATTTNTGRATTTRPNAGRASVASAGTTVSNTSNNTTTARSTTARGTRATTNAAARVSRAASSNLVRSLSAHSGASVSRAAIGGANMSRAGVARATAVFSDISKIGSGYANCRESYATCMDQFCANANDTYRRCFCSDRFTEFRDTEYALDEAKLLLMQFQDNNLNAVDKTAAEVNAMYTATAGEMAIKNDVSGASKMLSEITDLLSGKKKYSSASSSSTSLGILSVDFGTDLDDIWSGDGSSLFGGGSQNFADLEGDALYNAANKQCLQIITDSCESSAVLNMARSSYSIMITQDCNAYQKNIDSKKETVQQTVRTAEKYLREARLEEYRTHNSADVNECITKVRNALTSDAACGANYKRCLDYTGAYINQSTGEPIYSTRLFQLTELITLGGVDDSRDILTQNPQFNQFLESRKMFATTALDSCRDLSDIVWNEFKRTALIEIAQAQDEKIEEIKMSCVSTMADCYDTQTSALRSFDDTTAQVTGALSARAARAMCEEKVMACATLYGNTDGCQFDSNGKLSNKNTASNTNCGLTALLTFVNSVDNVRISEGCSTAIDSHIKDLCTPTSGTQGYPWNCRTLSEAEIRTNLNTFVKNYCADPTVQTSTPENEFKEQIDRAIADVVEQLDYQLEDACLALDGYWVTDTTLQNGGTKLKAFYSSVVGGNEDKISLGTCLENSVMVRCLSFNADSDSATPIASYDRTRDECVLSEEWYKSQCSLLVNGYYENGVCYVGE